MFVRMGTYAPESVPTRPQLLLKGGARSERPRVPAAMMDEAADFLINANINNPDNEGFDVQAVAAPERSRHQRDHHGIRSAAQRSAAS